MTYADMFLLICGSGIIGALICLRSKNKKLRLWLTMLLGIIGILGEILYLLCSKIGTELMTDPNFLTAAVFSAPIVVSILYLSLALTEIVHENK